MTEYELTEHGRNSGIFEDEIYKSYEGKIYFYPIKTDRSCTVCLSPKDNPVWFRLVEEKSASAEEIIISELPKWRDCGVQAKRIATNIIKKLTEAKLLQITPKPTDSAIEAGHEGLPIGEPVPEPKVDNMEELTRKIVRAYTNFEVVPLNLVCEEQQKKFGNIARFILDNYVPKKEIEGLIKKNARTIVCLDDFGHGYNSGINAICNKLIKLLEVHNGK